MPPTSDCKFLPETPTSTTSLFPYLSSASLIHPVPAAEASTSSTGLFTPPQAAETSSPFQVNFSMKKIALVNYSQSVLFLSQHYSSFRTVFLNFTLVSTVAHIPWWNLSSTVKYSSRIWGLYSRICPRFTRCTITNWTCCCLCLLPKGLSLLPKGFQDSYYRLFQGTRSLKEWDKHVGFCQRHKTKEERMSEIEQTKTRKY